METVRLRKGDKSLLFELEDLQVSARKDSLSSCAPTDCVLDVSQTGQ